MEFLKNIISSIVANIVYIILIGLLSLCKPVMELLFQYEVPIGFILMGVVIITLLWRINATSFDWDYFYIIDRHVYTLEKDGHAIHEEYIGKIIQTKYFDNTISGYMDWSDVKNCNVKIDSHIRTAKIQFKLENSDNKNEVIVNEQALDLSMVNGKCTYKILYPTTECADVKITVNMEYDKKQTKEFFVAIYRPMLLLDIKLKVSNEINLLKLSKTVKPLYGVDTGHVRLIKLKKNKKDLGYNVYRMIIFKPKFLYNYVLSWEW